MKKGSVPWRSKREVLPTSLWSKLATAADNSKQKHSAGDWEAENGHYCMTMGRKKMEEPVYVRKRKGVKKSTSLHDDWEEENRRASVCLIRKGGREVHEVHSNIGRASICLIRGGGREAHEIHFYAPTLSGKKQQPSACTLLPRSLLPLRPPGISATRAQVYLESSTSMFVTTTRLTLTVTVQPS